MDCSPVRFYSPVPFCSPVRGHRSRAAWPSLALALVTLVPASGCIPLLFATGIYMFQGGNLVPAECEVPLEEQRVVVFCRPPASHEYRHAGAARQIANRVSDLLEINVPGVEVVSQKQVDQWIDENDSDDFKVLGKAVKADLVIHIELGHFELFKGKTVYQGNADVTVNLHDMNDKARLVWDKSIGEVLYPVNSGIAVQDKSVTQFQREFVEIVSDSVAKNFYSHDPTQNFAIDAMANR